MRTHSQQMMDELTESYDHLRMAAAHAAGGAAEKMTPPYDRARMMANKGWKSTIGSFEPIYNQMREGANQARERMEPTKRRNRTPLMVGLLAAGIAAGAAGALAARRRRMANQWDDYEPLTELESTYGSPTESGSKGKVSQGVASVAESVSHKAGQVADSLRSSSPGSNVSSAGDKAAEMTEKAKDSMAGTADKAAEGAEQTRSKMKDR
jgi:hypothetical protein